MKRKTTVLTLISVLITSLLLVTSVPYVKAADETPKA
jgi:hypothetical protein